MVIQALVSNCPIFARSVQAGPNFNVPYTTSLGVKTRRGNLEIRGGLSRWYANDMFVGSYPAYDPVDKVRPSDFFLAVQRYFFIARVPPNRQLNRIGIVKWRNANPTSLRFCERAIHVDWVNLVHVPNRK
jgi:hypothetical protein